MINRYLPAAPQFFFSPSLFIPHDPAPVVCDGKVTGCAIPRQIMLTRLCEENMLWKGTNSFVYPDNSWWGVRHEHAYFFILSFDPSFLSVLIFYIHSFYSYFLFFFPFIHVLTFPFQLFFLHYFFCPFIHGFFLSSLQRQTILQPCRTLSPPQREL